MSTSTIYLTTILSIILVTGLILQKLNVLTITIISLILFIIAIIIKYNYRISLKLELPKQIKLNKFIIILLIVMIFTITFKMIAIMITPSYAYDANVYHLPNLIDYIQKQKIYLSEKIIWSNTYPRNIEMFNLWNIIFVKRTFLAEFAQVFISIFGAIATYGILKINEMDDNKSILGAILFLSTPIVLAQMSTAYIDTVVAALIIAIIYFMCHYFKNKAKDAIIYMSLLLGILLGSKYSCISYTAILIFGFIALDFFTFNYNKKYYKKPYDIKNIYIVLILTVLMGSSWYLQNFKNFENPMHPFNLKIHGNNIFEGWDVSKIMMGNTPTILKQKNKVEAILTSWIGVADDRIINENEQSTELNNKTLVTMYDTRIGGFGFGWLYIMVPSFIIYVINVILKKKGTTNDILVMLLPIICFLITPSNWWTRYVCFILITGIYSFMKIFNNNKLAYAIISVLIVFNCITGSMFDILKSIDTINSYDKYSNFPIDSIYHVSDKNMKQIIKKVNNNKENIIFAIGNARHTDIYYYFGENLQNQVKCYYNGYDKYLKNYNISNHKDLDKFMKIDYPNYIIISNEETRFYDKLEFIKNNYIKIIDGSICLFERTT